MVGVLNPRDYLSEPKGLELSLILEGCLEAISEVGTSYVNKYSDIIGPGNTVTSEKRGHYSKLVIKVEEKTHEIFFGGIVFPDSIGHFVKIYSDKSNRVRHILDVDLGRSYT